MRRQVDNIRSRESAIPSVRAPVSDNDQNPVLVLVGSDNTPVSAEETSCQEGREPDAQEVAGQD